MPESSPWRDPRSVDRVFVLRVWCERHASAPDTLRASVVDVNSNERFFFTRAGEAAEFLSRRLFPVED